MEAHCNSQGITFPRSFKLDHICLDVLSFLHEVNLHPELYKGPAVAAAISRYENYWLPLAAKQENVNLEPPLDVAWIWHIHMLCPTGYERDCMNVVGKVVDHKPASMAQRQKNRVLARTVWTQAYPGIPFDMPKRSPTKPAEAHLSKSKISYDLASAAQRQGSFVYQVSLPHYYDPKWLKIGLLRYRAWLALKKQHREVFLVPTYDIDLMWHTHQLHPLRYKEDMMKFLGFFLPHDDTDTDRSQGSKLHQGGEATANLYSTTYGVHYAREGAMYRGPEPHRTIQVFQGSANARGVNIHTLPPIPKSHSYVFGINNITFTKQFYETFIGKSMSTNSRLQVRFRLPMRFPRNEVRKLCGPSNVDATALSDGSWLFKARPFGFHFMTAVPPFFVNCVLRSFESNGAFRAPADLKTLVLPIHFLPAAINKSKELFTMPLIRDDIEIGIVQWSVRPIFKQAYTFHIRAGAAVGPLSAGDLEGAGSGSAAGTHVSVPNPADVSTGAAESGVMNSAVGGSGGLASDGIPSAQVVPPTTFVSPSQVVSVSAVPEQDHPNLVGSQVDPSSAVTSTVTGSIMPTPTASAPPSMTTPSAPPQPQQCHQQVNPCAAPTTQPVMAPSPTQVTAPQTTPTTMGLGTQPQESAKFSRYDDFFSTVYDSEGNPFCHVVTRHHKNGRDAVTILMDRARAEAANLIKPNTVIHGDHVRVASVHSMPPQNLPLATELTAKKAKNVPLLRTTESFAYLIRDMERDREILTGSWVGLIRRMNGVPRGSRGGFVGFRHILKHDGQLKASRRLPYRSFTDMIVSAFHRFEIRMRTGTVRVRNLSDVFMTIAMAYASSMLLSRCRYEAVKKAGIEPVKVPSVESPSVAFCAAPDFARHRARTERQLRGGQRNFVLVGGTVLFLQPINMRTVIGPAYRPRDPYGYRNSTCGGCGAYSSCGRVAESGGGDVIDSVDADAGDCGDAGCGAGCGAGGCGGGSGGAGGAGCGAGCGASGCGGDAACAAACAGCGGGAGGGGGAGCGSACGGGGSACAAGGSACAAFGGSTCAAAGGSTCAAAGGSTCAAAGGSTCAA
eukprot:Rmarinus@m.26121